MKRIGIIGYGLIGQYIYQHLGEMGETEAAFIYDLNAAATAGLDPRLVLESPEQLSLYMENHPVDLVVESATAQALQQLAPMILSHADMLTFSSCAFADEAFMQKTQALCRQHGHKIYIPHGAVLGYDGIFDSREILEEVSITTTKKPQNLGSSVTECTVLFQGPTREACKKFPRNVNVHAGIALAGLGFDKTVSRIVADPQVEGNTHQIDVKADGVWFRIEVCSIPQGLVSGAYTPISAFNSVKRLIADHDLLRIC